MHFYRLKILFEFSSINTHINMHAIHNTGGAHPHEMKLNWEEKQKRG
jgi:hypothetical protein